MRDRDRGCADKQIARRLQKHNRPKRVPTRRRSARLPCRGVTREAHALQREPPPSRTNAAGTIKTNMGSSTSVSRHREVFDSRANPAARSTRAYRAIERSRWRGAMDCIRLLPLRCADRSLSLAMPRNFLMRFHQQRVLHDHKPPLFLDRSRRSRFPSRTLIISASSDAKRTSRQAT
jgi:hypothetical protein